MSINDTNFSRQSLISMSGNVLFLVLSFLGSIIIARIVGPSGYGKLYYILAISTVVANFVEGWATACGKKQSEKFFSKDVAISLSLSFSIVFSIIILFVLFLYTSFFEFHNYIIIMIALVLIGKSFHLSTYQSFKSTEKYGYNSYVLLINNIFRLFFQLTLLYLGYGVTGLVVGFFIGDILTSAVVLFYMNFNIVKPGYDDINEIYNFAKYSIPSKFVRHSFDKVDVVMLFTLSTSAIAGNYQTAIQLSLPAMITSNALSSSLRTKISNTHSADRNYTETLKTAVNYGSFLAIPMFFGSIIVGEELVKFIYGNSFAISGILIPYLIFIKLVITQRAIYQSALNAINKPKFAVISNLLGLVTNIILGIILFIEIDYIGIIYASIISTVLSYLLSYYYLDKSMNYEFNPISRDIILQIFSSLVMFIFVYASYQFSHNYLNTFIIIFLGGIIYLSTYYFIQKIFYNNDILKGFISKVL